MRSETNLKNYYFPILCILIIVFAAFETAIWKNLFEFLPSPLLWLSVIVYASITRPIIEVLILIYASTFFLQTMTIMPIGYLLLIETTILLFIKSFKTRVFWEGRSYFLILHFFAIIIFHLQHILLSYFFEEVPIKRFMILSWLGEFVVFIIFSPLIYWMYTAILPIRDTSLDDEDMVMNG